MRRQARLPLCPGGATSRTLRRFGRGNDRGASAIELVILAPALIFVSMLIIQFALWLDGTHAALAAAQEGDRTAREAEFNQSGWQQTATQVAMSYYHGLDTSVLGNVSVSRISYDQGANTVAVTVSGRLTGIFPLSISETVSGPVECFRTSASEGRDC
jgi:Flp pilus assembly protein TadG